MEEHRCRIVATAMEDSRCSSSLNSGLIEVEDLRYKSLRSCSVIEVEDRRCNSAMIGMEDPQVSEPADDVVIGGSKGSPVPSPKSACRQSPGRPLRMRAEVLSPSLQRTVRTRPSPEGFKPRGRPGKD